MEEKVATWLLGALGAYKIFETLIMKFWTKKEKEEDSQSSKIEALKSRCDCLERDVLILQSEKVSRKELDKKLENLTAQMSNMNVCLARIEGMLKNKEEN